MKRLIHFPKIRLSEIVNEFGGVNRADAIKGAQDELQSMRGQADRAIGESLAALEQIAAAPQTAAAYASDQVNRMLELCDQIVTLAGTFGYQTLDSAARYLCDLVDGLRQAGTDDVPAIRVHVQAMRLVAPGSPALPPDQQERVISELAKILDHHGFGRASDAADRTVVGP